MYNAVQILLCSANISNKLISKLNQLFHQQKYGHYHPIPFSMQILNLKLIFLNLHFTAQCFQSFSKRIAVISQIPFHLQFMQKTVPSSSLQ